MIPCHTIQGREPQTSSAALEEKQELEVTELDQGKGWERLQGMIDAQEQLHEEAVTRHGACRESDRRRRSRGK